ncbi:MAG TPA: stage V sporulation protein AB [Candidatus Anaerostipes avistercoris]|uniref:Stage V sporulation protein AB n=1 Tax=Candidatus Anaerostipes avistercoris TaxID=2838462 RepID=A0A9D2PHW4_9FIRM|nr:stage V sporulation protein AB [Candidatus Anaerostipes avistercoris]
MWIREAFLMFCGLSAGALIAGSFLAFLSMIGVIPRLAALTKSVKYARLYEDCIALGGITGTAVFLYRWQIPLGNFLLLLFGLFGGIFVGCLIGALAEVLKSIPVFSRRIALRKGIALVIYALALGKMLGCYLQFYVFE